MWWSLREKEEIRVLRGVLCMTKSGGPRTEPWGNKKRSMKGQEVVITFNTE